MHHDVPPFAAVYQQAQRWHAAGCFGQLAGDLRAALRLAAGRKADPSAVIIDSRTLRLMSKSYERAGYDGAKRKQGSKLHVAVDTLGHLLAMHVTPADADDRVQVRWLAKAVQVTRNDSIKIAFVDHGYTGENSAGAARGHELHWRSSSCPRPSAGLILSLLKNVLLPGRWVVELSFAWAARFRCLVKDCERYADTLTDLHLVVFVCLMLKKCRSFRGRFIIV